MKSKLQIRTFGLYLVACSLYQGVLYMRPRGAASVFDPRLGFWLFLGGEESVVGWIEWASAVCLLLLGLWLALRGHRALLEIYVVAEAVFAFPTGIFIAVSLFGGAGHLAAGGSAPILFGVFLVFTCAPMAASVYLLAKKITEPLNDGLANPGPGE